MMLFAIAPCCSAHAQTVIVLDPGHSGKDVKSIDVETGLVDHDYPNHPEMEECFRVAYLTGKQLEKHGYKVVYTKRKVNDTVSLRARSDIAKRAGAAIGISIHNDHSQTFRDFAQVYAQQVGQWRGGKQTKPKAVFDNKGIAALSLQFATSFAAERTKTEHHPVSVTPINFDNRAGIEPGNIPQVMLFAGSDPNAIPWIYNEVGGKGFNRKNEVEYANGIAAAIEKCVSIATPK